MADPILKNASGRGAGAVARWLPSAEALYLDKLYIPTRYPDALAELIPAEAYTRKEAETARDHASTLLTLVGGWLEAY